MTRTLALDPALACGWAWSDDTEMIHGVWYLKASGSEHTGRPLQRLHEHILRMDASHGIDRVVFENASQGSAHEQVKVFHNRVSGVILAAAARIGATWDQYVPSTIKAFAGHGRASKEQMVAWLKSKMDITVRSDDEADAIWILLLDQHRRKYPQAAREAAAKKPKAVRERKRKAPRLF